MGLIPLGATFQTITLSNPVLPPEMPCLPLYLLKSHPSFKASQRLCIPPTHLCSLKLSAFLLAVEQVIHSFHITSV